MMLLFYLTVLLGETLATNQECPGQIATTYEKEMLKTPFDNPREFALDKGLNTLYFTYGENSQLGKIHLSTKKFSDVVNFQSYSQTVNQENHDLYISMKDGILKYDARRFMTEFVGETYTRRLVNSLYFNKDLYYTEALSGLVYKITDDRDVMVKFGNGKVEHFVIDGNGTYFIINESGLYTLDKNNMLVLYNEGIRKKEGKALTTDNNGEVIACTDHGIFHVNKEKRILENVVTQMANNCSGLAIDRNNDIVFSDGVSIIRLKHKTKCIQVE